MPTFPDNTFVQDSTTGEISVYRSGTFHWVSPPVIAKMGLSPSQITTVENAEYTLVPKGSDYFPDGIFVQNSQTGEISRYSAGAGHLVTVPIANKLGLTAPQMATITPAQYNIMPRGNDYIPDGWFVQNTLNGAISQYSDGALHAVSPQVAGVLKLAPSQIVQIADDQYANLPKANDYYPEGIYIVNQQTGDFSQYSGGQLHWLSPSVLSSVNPPQSQTVLASAAQYNAISKGNDYFPDGMFLQNAKTGEISIYLLGQRHWISGPVYSQMGLTASQLVSISDAQYGAISRGTDYVPPASA